MSYTVHYDNIGNYDAENTLITETIPDSTCFIVGSI
ncbi:MAG: hypothetical protein LBI53_06575 [Candidatus Peribacteria bacterium]|nr:hypothetical protein [Candidatus Peribacteria bacterium]